jgi:DNA replication protein DnaC
MTIDQWQARLITAGFPERQSRMDRSALTGAAWKSTGKSIASKIGEGFLMALVGESGTGKTQMAIGLAGKYVASTFRYVKTMTLFLQLRAAMGNDCGGELALVREHISPAFLVIDEAGERGGSEWEDRMLAYIIDERYATRKDTLLIANQKQDVFSRSVGPRIMSRLQETGGIVVCDWPSYRSAKVKEK